jgi:N-acetylglucosamine-6-phosphate deacetylase
MDRSVNRLLFYNVYLFTPSAGWLPGWLLTEGHTIRWLGPGQPPEFPAGFITQRIDGRDLNLLPGFIDLHVHGAVGFELMDGDAAGIKKISQFYSQHGVTGFLATTWAASHAKTLDVVRVVNSIINDELDGAKILGVHLEGPYLNRERRGAQDFETIRPANLAEAVELIENVPVKLIAIAPEIPGNLELIDECVRRGIAVAAGHTNATYEEMVLAVQHGVRQVTHCFSGMSPFNHRQPGAVGAALALEELSCELIADNIHVHPAAMKVLLKAKGTDGIILITDAMRAVGLEDGTYPIGDGRTVQVRNGAVRLPEGNLAGSVLTLERGLKNLVQASGQSLLALWKTSSLNAARAIGLANCKGSLEIGKDADLVLLDADLNVRMTVVEGKIIYTQPTISK